MTRQDLVAAYTREGGNFMTPKVLAVLHCPEKLTSLELAQGTGMQNQPIWGVTVLVFNEDGRRHYVMPDPSRLYQTYDEAVADFSQRAKELSGVPFSCRV